MLIVFRIHDGNSPLTLNPQRSPQSGYRRSRLSGEEAKYPLWVKKAHTRRAERHAERVYGDETER
jgi:hypothetical protein